MFYEYYLAIIIVVYLIVMGLFLIACIKELVITWELPPLTPEQIKKLREKGKRLTGEDVDRLIVELQAIVERVRFYNVSGFYRPDLEPYRIKFPRESKYRIALRQQNKILAMLEGYKEVNSDLLLRVEHSSVKMCARVNGQAIIH
jgi:hypothetical protein